MPNASIIIPTHNEGKYLPNLLKSIDDFVDFSIETIVVDNGSIDETGEIAATFGARLIKLQEKIYPSVARNIGASEAKSDVYIFLDADTIITESWANEAKKIIGSKEFNSIPMLAGESYHISTAPSWVEKYWFSPLKENDTRTYINGGNIIVSKVTFQKLGGFNSQLETGEDVDLSNRAKHSGVQVRFFPGLIVHHEGFPKNIYNFFKREKWHGKGDFMQFAFFKESLVAQIAAFFGICYIALATAFLAIIIFDSSLGKLTILAVSNLILAICFGSSVVKFHKSSPTSVLFGTYLYFIYFNARLTSFFSVFLEKIRHS